MKRLDKRFSNYALQHVKDNRSLSLEPQKFQGRKREVEENTNNFHNKGKNY